MKHTQKEIYAMVKHGMRTNEWTTNYNGTHHIFSSLPQDRITAMMRRHNVTSILSGVKLINQSKILNIPNEDWHNYVCN